MAAQFKVHGPLEIPAERRPGGRAITRDVVADFWSKNPSLADERGCYLFAMRAGGGIVPGYVGKAALGPFSNEAFTHDKLSKYQQFMTHYARGTPVMFFLSAPNGRGRPNGRAITECEHDLIVLAARASPKLINVHGTSGPSFVIPHVTEETRGRPSHATLALLQALLLDEPKRLRVQQETTTPPLSAATESE